MLKKETPIAKSKQDEDAFVRHFKQPWNPQSPEFRANYNSLWVIALLKGYNKGDFSLMSLLARYTPDETLRRTLIFRLETEFPLLWLWHKSKFDIDGRRTYPPRCKKVYSNWGDPFKEKILSFKAVSINNFIAPAKTGCHIKEMTLNRDEFADFIINSIMFNRKAFTADELTTIRSLLSKIEEDICQRARIHSKETA